MPTKHAFGFVRHNLGCKSMDLKETDILGEKIVEHWYYRSKSKAMMKLLSGLSPSTILDIGAGSGFFSNHLLKNSYAKKAWCVDIEYKEDADTFCNGKPLHFRSSVGKVDADLVLLMDVLEHVDDDVSLLRDVVVKVPCGAKFLISVPAFQFLWSNHDIFLEHKRRYSLTELRDAVEESGLYVNHMCYYFSLVLPMAATLRILQRIGLFKDQVESQMQTHHPLVNSFLKNLCDLELHWLQLNRLAGLTVFCLAEKR